MVAVHGPVHEPCSLPLTNTRSDAPLLKRQRGSILRRALRYECGSRPARTVNRHVCLLRGVECPARAARPCGGGWITLKSDAVGSVTGQAAPEAATAVGGADGTDRRGRTEASAE